MENYIAVPPEHNPPTLEEAKAAKLQQIKSIRNFIESSPLNNFDVDANSITRLQIAQNILSGTAQTLDWTMADNSVKTITADDIAQVFADLAERSNNLHAKYRDLKERINSAESVEEVAAIEWGKTEE